MNSKFTILFFIGVVGLLIAEVRAGGNGDRTVRPGSLLYNLLPPSDEEIEAFHEVKPTSEEDLRFVQELYHAIVSGDGTYLEEHVGETSNKNEEKASSYFATKLKEIISKILGNDKTDEEIQTHHEFKEPLSPDTLKQLTTLYETVGEGVVEPASPEQSGQEEPSSSEPLPSEPPKEPSSSEPPKEPSSSEPPKKSFSSKTSKRPQPSKTSKGPSTSGATMKRPVSKITKKPAPKKLLKKNKECRIM
ncbi:proteoglycan 4-like [Contarinia nasturtii]|uniref:proteoglycan 4-like n=1 Tax=Contarinia nasturtii TaxID=265458 RepID=UPI0012D38350|nr:proteoglycan 4-like [Contarinia nasturtii]